ncbi:phosphoribosylformylglycinamidine cyclo-ligase [[Eubacterium] cellulosolvens]
MSWSYAKAGVDVKKVKKTQNEIGSIIEETFKFRDNKFGQVLGKFGHYASLIDIGSGKALALHSDGCGTKVLISQLMKKFDTIGIDCIAMCVNDLICLGAEPVVLIDYLAVETINESMINEIIKGLVEGAKTAKVSIVGGETAVMPDVIKGAEPGLGFDLAALCTGVVDKEKIIDGKDIEVGDIIIGLESSGIHSNGLTLARKVLLDQGKLSLDDKPEGLDNTLGEELLRPTRIYTNEVLSMIKNFEVHGIAHITGGAFRKLRRFENYSNVGFDFKINRSKSIFDLIQKVGRITYEEMYKTFNMGIGICIIVPKEIADDIVTTSEKHNTEAFSIGKVVKELGVKIRTDEKILKI